MVVASLIATMAFKVVINPPSGFWQDTIQGNSLTKPHTTGFSIMANDDAVNYLSVRSINTVAFLAFLSIILIVVSGFRLRHMFLMCILVMIMGIAIISIVFTYAHTLRVFMLFFNRVYSSRCLLSSTTHFAVLHICGFRI